MGDQGDRRARVLAGHDRQCAVEFFIAQREVRDVVRGLAGAPRPARFAQVESVEGQTLRGEEVGECRLEEVVREAVHVQDGGARRLFRAGLAPHQHRGDRALSVRVGA